MLDIPTMNSLARLIPLLAILGFGPALADMSLTLPAPDSTESGSAISQSRQAPAWTLGTPAGETVRFPDDAGKRPSVLLFWPSWCPFSRALQPYVQDIWEDYRERGVNVWTINILENSDPVQTMKDRQLSFPLLLDGDPLIPGYGIQRTPWLVVVDADNRIVYTRPAKAPSPIHVAKAVRRTLNSLIGDQAVPLPETFPRPYDLHLKGRSQRRSSGLDSEPQKPANATDWNAWAHEYLADFAADAPAPDLSPVVLHDKDRSPLEQARQRWRDQYGEEHVSTFRQFRAYRLKDLWLMASASQATAHGSGLLLVLEADTGRILHIAGGTR